MKKRLFLTIALFFAPALVMAAQKPVTQIDKFNSAATKIDDVRVATNVRLAAAQSNFTELYTLLGGNPWLAQTTAPSIHNVFWLDTTGSPPTIKYWDGDSWEIAAAGGDGTHTLPVASAETSGGVKVGDRLTITDGVLSADAQIPTGEVGQILVYDTTETVVATTVSPLTNTEVAGLFTGTSGALCKDGTAGDCGISGGSFTLDTFPTYSDSPHTSGIAVNSTHLAVYSAGAGEWGLVPLTFSLSPTPVFYTLTVTDPGNGDKITCEDSDLVTAIDCGDGATACTSSVENDSTVSAITYTADAGRVWTGWTGDITGDTSDNGTVTILGGNASGSGTSSAGLSDVTYTINTAATVAYGLNDSKLIGQSWTVPSGGGGTLKSVIFNVGTVTTGGTLSCRVGTASNQIDMSTNYASGSVGISTSGEVTVPITDGPTVVVGSKYAVACHISTGTSVTVMYSNTNPYSGGGKYSTTASDWDLTTHEDANDFYFKYVVNQ